MASKQIQAPILPQDDDTVLFGPETVDGEVFALTGKDIHQVVASIRANEEDRNAMSDQLMKNLRAAFSGHAKPEPNEIEDKIIQKHISKEKWPSFDFFAPYTFEMLRWNVLFDEKSILNFTKDNNITIEFVNDLKGD